MIFPPHKIQTTETLIMLGNLFVSLFTSAIALLITLSRRPNDGFKAWGQRVLFVIAHPDDEAMFFVPTVVQLVNSGVHVHLLCLSSGNFDGLGAIRTKELQASAAVLGIHHAETIEHPQLQDGPRSKWPADTVADIISKYCQQHRIQSLATFDAGGVSGHPNHIDTAKGVIQAHRSLNVPCFQLETTNIARKYSGPLDIFWSMYRSGTASSIVAVSAAPMISYRAMQAHHSQFVWFRYLFVIFSRYTFMNTWNPVA